MMNRQEERAQARHLRRKQVSVEEKTRLIKDLIGGDDTAYERFVDLFGTRIFAFSMKMCGNRQDAEDVMQETLIKALTAIGDLRSPEALETWLFRIASNSCLMSRRKAAPVIDLGRSVGRAGEAQTDLIVPERSDLPEDIVLRKERFEILTRAIRALPPKLRIALVLRDMEGFSTRETAEILDITEGNVKVILHRARLKARELFEEAYRPDLEKDHDE